MTEIYFDNSATTRVSAAAAAAALRMMREDYGNPSALHRQGSTAARALGEARQQLARHLAVPAQELLFTASGTESNNLVLFGIAQAAKRKGKRILVSAVEHPSVLEPAKKLAQDGYEVIFLAVDADGRVKLEELAEQLTAETILVSVQQVNNEVGALQPLKEIGRLIKERAPQACFHVDGVQSFAKLPVELLAWRIDAFSASAHKLHGPKGVGLLWLRSGLKLPPLLYGGGQERGLRSGTENMPGICAFAAAAEEAFADLPARAAQMRAVKQALAEALQARIPHCYFNGRIDEASAPHILNVSFPGARSEVLLHYLEQEGVSVSSGSACHAWQNSASHVLWAMGLDNQRLDSALRFSFCAANTITEALQAAEITAAAVADLRSLSGIHG